MLGGDVFYYKTNASHMLNLRGIAKEPISRRMTRGAFQNSVNRWPLENGKYKLRFKFQDFENRATERNRVRSAMSEWESGT